MPAIEFEGICFLVDDNSHLTDPEQWCDQWLQRMIDEGEVNQITDEHLGAMNWLRWYYSKHNKIPTPTTMEIALNCPPEIMNSLFSNGIKGLCRVSGLPKPEHC